MSAIPVIIAAHEDSPDDESDKEESHKEDTPPRNLSI